MELSFCSKLTQAHEDFNGIFVPPDSSTNVTDSNTTLIAEQAFVQAYLKIDSVSSVLNDMYVYVLLTSIQWSASLNMFAPHFEKSVLALNFWAHS